MLLRSVSVLIILHSLHVRVFVPLHCYFLSCRKVLCYKMAHMLLITLKRYFNVFIFVLHIILFVKLSIILPSDIIVITHVNLLVDWDVELCRIHKIVLPIIYLLWDGRQHWCTVKGLLSTLHDQAFILLSGKYRKMLRSDMVEAGSKREDFNINLENVVKSAIPEWIKRQKWIEWMEVY